MARRKFTPADLAAQLGMTKEEVQDVPQPQQQPVAQPQSGVGADAQRGAAVQSLDKPQEGEVAIYMDLGKIHSHPKNRRLKGEDSVIELAMNIQKVGLLEYPLAWVNPQGECELLSGHHRYAAYVWLRDNVDSTKYSKMPVRFRENIESENDALRILYSANFYNEGLTPSERAQSAAFIYDDIDHKRETDMSLAGVRAADAAAETLNMKARTISRLVRIHRSLIDDLKQLWDADIITQTQAEELSGLSFVYQEEFFKLAKDCSERLTKQQYTSLRAKAVGTDPAKRKAGRPRTPSSQLRNYMRGFVKKGREMKEWRDAGGEVDQHLLGQMKAIIEMLEEK